MYLFAAVSSLPTPKTTPGLNGILVDEAPEAVEAVEAVDHNLSFGKSADIHVDASLRGIPPRVIPYFRRDPPIAIP